MSISNGEAVHLDIRPVAGKIGAEIAGVCLSGDLDEPAITAIRQALYRYKGIFFRSQSHLDERTQEAFGKRLGDLVPHPTVPSLKGTDYVLDIDSGRGVRASSWHTDVTFVDAYPQASILRALVVPEYGGDTIWANTAAAYQSLPPKLRDLADQLWALHSNAYDYARHKPNASPEATKRYYEVFTSTVYETEHPVVPVHPGTGERTLTLGHYVQKFLDLPSADSAHLLAVLQDQLTRFKI